MAQCTKTVGNNAVGFRCLIQEDGHDGPCQNPAFQPSVVERANWERDQASQPPPSAPPQPPQAQPAAQPPAHPMDVSTPSLAEMQGGVPEAIRLEAPGEAPTLASQPVEAVASQVQPLPGEAGMEDAAPLGAAAAVQQQAEAQQQVVDSGVDFGLSNPQPPPVSNGEAAAVALVIDDLGDRLRMGVTKYGTPLQPLNGRDTLIDVYQEGMDQVAYLRAFIQERAAVAAWAFQVQDVLNKVQGDNPALVEARENISRVVSFLAGGGVLPPAQPGQEVSSDG